MRLESTQITKGNTREYMGINIYKGRIIDSVEIVIGPFLAYCKEIGECDLSLMEEEVKYTLRKIKPRVTKLYGSNTRGKRR